MTAILATERLRKRFGGVTATDDVTLAVLNGELRCIIGPNGAGKSTLFALLCGIHRPDGGRILLKGRDATYLPSFRRVRLGVGLTFQTNRAYHNLTVLQNLEAPLRVARTDRPKDADERFRYALSAFGLDRNGSMLARELPHHQLQWLEISMVLAGGPDVLLLDEPTAGMSPEETLQTARVLKRINAAGMTIVVVEHDIAFVREVATRVTVLHHGRVFAEGTIEEITAHEDVRRIYLGAGLIVPAILEIDGLRSGYATGDVLQGVGLSVGEGEIVGVVGRNGVGKSTLMKTIIGLLPARSGNIRFKGQDVTGLAADRRARRGMGYVPQGREIFPKMTVLDNLRMGQFINRAPGSFALDEAYRWFPFLRERSAQRGGTLSGGQQEMLAIARALINGPDLLLLDEPSDGVQPSIVQEIGRFILELVQRKPIGVLLVEQNIDLLQTVAQRAYALDKGRVVATIGRDELADAERLAEFLAV